jgi:hypothetical protein
MKGILQLLIYVSIWSVAVFVTMGLALVLLGLVLFLTFAGADKRADKASDQISTTLMDSEELYAEAIQHRVFALWGRRAVLAITNSRILVMRRGLLGGFKMQDVQWKDLEDVTIEQNVLASLCGSNLHFKHLNKGVAQIEVNGIASDVAPSIYAKAQHEEQAWEEKRRIRGIEEVRAAAGGVVVHTGSSNGSGEHASRGGNRMLEEIAKAKELLDMGAVSDAEFQEMKSKILGAA